MNYQSPPHPSKLSKLTTSEVLASLAFEPFTTEQQAFDLLMAQEKFSSRIGLADQSSWKYSRYETFLPALKSVTRLNVSRENSKLAVFAYFNHDHECTSEASVMSAPGFADFQKVLDPHVGVSTTVWHGQIQGMPGIQREVWLGFYGRSKKCLLTFTLEQNNNL